MGGVQFGLAFVLRRGNTSFLRTSVHVASMIDCSTYDTVFLDTTQKLNVTIG